MTQQNKSDSENRLRIKQPPEMQSETPAVVRRRLLKGAGLALPTILTLRSGAVLAQTSSMCLNNARLENNKEFNIATDGAIRMAGDRDEWFRQTVTVRIYQRVNNSVAEELLVYRDGILNIWRYAGFYSEPRSYPGHPVAMGSSAPIMDTGNLDAFLNKNGDWTFRTESLSGFKAVAYINENAEIVGHGPVLGQGEPATESCAASFEMTQTV